MGPAQARQFLLCVPMVAAPWKMFNQAVSFRFLHPFTSHERSFFLPSIRHPRVGIIFAFSDRRAQKAAQAADARAKGGHPPIEDSFTEDDASAEDELDSDDGAVDGVESNRVEERRRVRAATLTDPQLSPLSAKKHRSVDGADNRPAPPWPDATSGGTALRKAQAARAIRPKGKYETDGIALVDPGMSATKLSRRLILGLADLDSVHGRYVISVISFPLRPSFVLVLFFFSFRSIRFIGISSRKGVLIVHIFIPFFF